MKSSEREQVVAKELERLAWKREDAKRAQEVDDLRSATKAAERELRRSKVLFEIQRWVMLVTYGAALAWIVRHW